MKILDKVRWGIIGVGDVTEVKSGPAFYKTEHSELVAVMRRNADKAADYARRHNVPKWYSNASDLIGDPDVNAVYIATPPGSHALYAIEAMKSGKPVYVEKPMARNYRECREMLSISNKTGMPLWVAYYRRTLPAYLKVRELIETGAIGKPLLVNITLFQAPAEEGLKKDELSWHVIPEISGGGHFFDLACHQLDYLDFLFGPVKKVSGIAANRGGLYSAEDIVTGTWEHESGVIGTGNWCFMVDKSSEEDKLEITGEKGAVSMPCFSHGSVTVRDSNGSKELTFTNPAHISQNLVQQVVNELKGIGRCVSAGESAARTNRVMDEIVKNYYVKYETNM
jgi:predicted dehydrogenase